MPGFTLKGKIQLDGSQWKSGLSQAKRQANTWSADVASMVRSRLSKAFLVGIVGAGINRATAKAGQRRDQATALGIDAETLQKLDFAVSQSGGSMTDAAKAIETLAVTMLDAERGSKAVLESFGRFGVTPEIISKLKADPDKMFQLLSEQVQQGVNTTDLGDLKKVMGRGAAALLPAFKAGLGQSMEAASKAGVVVSNEKNAELAAAGDAIVTIVRQKDRVVNEAIITLGESLKAGAAAAAASDVIGLTFDRAKAKGQENTMERRLLQKIADNSGRTANALTP